MESNYATIAKGSKIGVCARVGGANTTSILAAHFAKRNTKFGGGGKRGRAPKYKCFASDYGVNKNSCFLLAP